jgi:hypothetical protein
MNPTPNRLEGTKLANFEPISSVSELQIIDLVEGTGDVVPEGATITAHYTGALCKDGTIFQVLTILVTRFRSASTKLLLAGQMAFLE